MTIPALKQSTAIIQQPQRKHNGQHKQKQQQKRQRFSCWYHLKMFNFQYIMALIMPIVLLLQLTAMSSYVNAQGE